MKTYITEAWLREHFSLADGTELHLPAGSSLTPSAQSLISERNLRIKFIDETTGQIFVEGSSGENADSAQKRVHPLTNSDQRHEMHCALCRTAVAKKPDTLTHLNADKLVSKADPRIQFRGLVDNTISFAVWLQAEFAEGGKPSWPKISPYLADVRSHLGNVMRAEATGELMAPVQMGAFDDKAIHHMSHAPLQHLGHDHIVPDATHGLTAARLNLLRTSIRIAEMAAAKIYISGDFEVSRPDIMQGLNRLSSAVYVLMIVALMLDRGMAVKETAWN